MPLSPTDALPVDISRPHSIATAMRLRLLFAMSLYSMLFGCGNDASTATSIAGHWAQETGSDQQGMTLQFDATSDKLMVHTAPEADGSHDHLHGSYTFDAATTTATVRCELGGTGKGNVWTGKLANERLSLTSGSTTLKFRKGTDPHK